MYLRLLNVVILLVFSVSASASRLDDMYADMDSKLMTSNLTYFNHYSPDAVFVSEKGEILNLEQQKQIFKDVTKAGVRIETYQSTILGSRTVKTSLTGTATALVVFSEEFGRATARNPENPAEVQIMDMTMVTTRVIDVTSAPWKIISEQTSLKPVKDAAAKGEAAGP